MGRTSDDFDPGALLMVQLALPAQYLGEMLHVIEFVMRARALPSSFRSSLFPESRQLQPGIGGADAPAAIFIDIIGRPFTPLAGVARRPAFRGAMYAGAVGVGAAAVGAAAYGAAAYGAPYPYARPARGYYPYPPCY